MKGERIVSELDTLEDRIFFQLFWSREDKARPILSAWAGAPDRSP